MSVCVSECECVCVCVHMCGCVGRMQSSAESVRVVEYTYTFVYMCVWCSRFVHTYTHQPYIPPPVQAE